MEALQNQGGNAGLAGTSKSLEIALFTRQLATLLSAGISLQYAIDLLAIQHARTHLSQELQEIARTIDAGASASLAFKAQQDTFGFVYVSVIALAESQGRLPVGLSRLADHVERGLRMRARIRGALMYPVLCLIASIVITYGIFVFMLPLFAPLLASMGGQLPLTTQILFELGALSRNPMAILIALLVIGAVGSICAHYVRHPAFRRTYDRVVLDMPLLGRLVRCSAQAQLCRDFGAMMSAAIPLVDAIKLVSQATPNSIYRDDLQQLERSVYYGLTLADHFTLHPRLYNPMFVGMVTLGEESGLLEESLLRAARLLEDQVDEVIAVLLVLLEPLALAAIAAVVAFISLSVFIPLYAHLSQQT